ncbi:MAG: hypothetical protein QM820_01985 [Minicystis sp.]
MRARWASLLGAGGLATLAALGGCNAIFGIEPVDKVLPGTGGAMAGTGGAMAGSSGTMAGTGGAITGTGGAPTSTGSAMSGTGGTMDLDGGMMDADSGQTCSKPCTSSKLCHIGVCLEGTCTEQPVPAGTGCGLGNVCDNTGTCIKPCTNAGGQCVLLLGTCCCASDDGLEAACRVSSACNAMGGTCLK